MRPLCEGNCEIERVSSSKPLGVAIREDLKWSHHIDVIVTKASKRLYAPWLLKRAGVNTSALIYVYRSSVRSILDPRICCPSLAKYPWVPVVPVVVVALNQFKKGLWRSSTQTAHTIKLWRWLMKTLYRIDETVYVRNLWQRWCRIENFH